MAKAKIEEILKRAKTTGRYDLMAKDDWERITDERDLEKLMQFTVDSTTAITDEEKALADHGARQIRAKYGYARTEDGGTEELNPDYTGDEFSFNPERTERYREAVKRYSKSGADAAEDTLYSLAGNTNGVPSSYARTAAEQAKKAQGEDKLTSLLSNLYDEEYKAFRAKKAEQAAALKQRQKEQQERAKKAQEELAARKKQMEEEAAQKQKAAKEAAEARAKAAKDKQEAQAKSQAEKKKKAEQEAAEKKKAQAEKNDGMKIGADGMYENAPSKLYADPKRKSTGGSEPIVYYANVLQRLVKAGATNQQIRAYLRKLATDPDGLTLQDRAMLIPAFWNAGKR